MMAEGIGGPKDDIGARQLFEKAAAQSHSGALERMGAFAQTGRGGPQDSNAAKAYYEQAAALGNEQAKAALKQSECRYVIKDKRGNFVTKSVLLSQSKQCLLAKLSLRTAKALPVRHIPCPSAGRNAQRRCV